ncbi:MAG: MASE1 domain-containing protein [Candidatus Sulfotelmatobacter sp.]
MPRFQLFKKLAIVTILGIVYFFAGKLGLRLAFANPSATAVWAATGIAFAAFLTIGYWVWPGILLAAFLTNITTAGSVATSIGIAVGNTLEGIIGAYLVNRFAGGRRFLDRTQDLFKFVFLAAMVSTMVSATCGVTSLALGGFATRGSYGNVWLTWWLGDATGDLVVAPVLILWAASTTVDWNKRRLAEMAILLFSLLLAGQVVFGGVVRSEIKNYPLEFLCIPSLIWVAFRFGQREAATAMLLLSGIAIRGTLLGFGPFEQPTHNASLLLLQAFMGVTSVMILALATVVSEHGRAESVRETLIVDLQEALNRIKTLKGLLPICAACKKIRDDKGYWNHIESYIRQHSEAEFTHSICPSCAQKLYPEEFGKGHEESG